MPESTLRPKSSVSLSKHEFVRQDIDDKWRRMQMTPTGMRIIRIQPSMNYTSLNKYQSRPSTAMSSPALSPRYTSTPTKGRTQHTAPHSQRPHSVHCNSNRALSAQSTGSRTGRDQTASSMRTTGTQTSLERAASAGLVREKPPSPANRPASSRSNHSCAYNARTCQPSHMYMNEDLRRTAKLNRPPSHVHSCDEDRDRERSTKSPRSPRRYDGTEVNLPNFMKGNEFLTHDKLTMGQKQYIWGVARIYSVSHLMQLKQRQYQSLLDYEFNRRLQNKDLTERQRTRELKEYMRYTRFIKQYDQRIPRASKQPGSSPSPCEEVSHIHRHVIKGWTTNPQSNDAYRVRQEEEREVRDLPDYPSGGDRISDSPDYSSDSPDSRTEGHYRVVMTRRGDSVEGSREKTQEERPASPTKTRTEEEDLDPNTGSGRNSEVGEQFSETDGNYL